MGIDWNGRYKCCLPADATGDKHRSRWGAFSAFSGQREGRGLGGEREKERDGGLDVTTYIPLALTFGNVTRIPKSLRKTS